jgi:hypothetical protein
MQLTATQRDAHAQQLNAFCATEVQLHGTAIECT